MPSTSLYGVDQVNNYKDVAQIGNSGLGIDSTLRALTFGGTDVIAPTDSSLSLSTIAASFSGNVILVATTSSVLGVVLKGANRFIHDYKPAANTGLNTFVGVLSGNFTMSSGTAAQASFNSGFGYQALTALTSGYNNTAVGYQALLVNTTGHYNTAVGYQALVGTTTGSLNTAVGYNVLGVNSTANLNTAIGSNILPVSSGAGNTVVGSSCLTVNDTGSSNVAIGYTVLTANTTGSNNVAVGSSAGVTVSGTLATMSNCTFLGYAATSTTDAITNSTALGNGAQVTASNQMMFGNTSVTASIFQANVGVNTGSNTIPTELTVVSTSASDPRGIMSAQYSTDAIGARIHFRKARGTMASPTTVVTGDVLGRLRFSGYDGSNFLQMGSIDCVSEGTIAATQVPTYLAFSTGTNASPSVLTERLRIDSAGLSTFTGAITASGILTLNSAVTTGATTSSGLVLSANSLTTGTGIYAASSSLTTGNLLNLTVTGTAAASSQTVLNISTSGAVTGSVTTYGQQISNTHTGASATNVALKLVASGATTANIALAVTGAIAPVADGTTALQWSNAAGTAVRMNLDTTNGCLGINSTAPVSPATFGTVLLIQNGAASDTGVSIVLKPNSGSGGSAAIEVVGSSYFRIYTNGVERARFQNTTTAFGVGTTNPQTAFSMDSGGVLSWEVSTGTADTGLARSSAGVIGVTNGSTTTYATLGNGGLSLTAGAYIRPLTNATSGILFAKADGTTNVACIDTTNARVGIGTITPGTMLQVGNNATSTIGTIPQLWMRDAVQIGSSGPCILTNWASSGYLGWGAATVSSDLKACFGGTSAAATAWDFTKLVTLCVNQGVTAASVGLFAWTASATDPTGTADTVLGRSASGKVYAGDGTVTYLVLGKDSSTTTAAITMPALGAASSAAGGTLTITGQNAGTLSGNNVGGDIVISAGAQNGSATCGNIYLRKNTNNNDSCVILENQNAGGGVALQLYASSGSQAGANRNWMLYQNYTAGALDFCTTVARATLPINEHTLVMQLTNTGCCFWTPIASTGAPGASLKLTTPAHTALTASTEYNTILTTAATQQFATGALATQRYMLLNAPTYGAVGASVITNAATLAISGAPIAGTNVAITNPYSLWCQAGVARFDGGLAGSPPINVQTGTTYTAVLTDAGYLVTLNNGSAITFTIPLNASVAFPINTVINLLQLGAGQVTVAATGGVTLTSYTSLVKLAGQYAAGSLVKTGTDSWTLFGNLGS